MRLTPICGNVIDESIWPPTMLNVSYSETGNIFPEKGKSQEYNNHRDEPKAFLAAVQRPKETELFSGHNNLAF